MSIVYDLNRQVGYLQQCLSSDKKPLAFFLGAGCPVSIRVPPDSNPLIPDIAGLTEMIREQINPDEEFGPLLANIEDQFKQDGKPAPTVEDMLTQIRALRAVAGNESARGLTGLQLDRLDAKLCFIIHEVADKSLPSVLGPYHQLAAWVNAVRRENPIEIFTTNYDLLMEQAFEDRGVPYFDGFAGVRRPFFDLRTMEEDMLPPRWARLWKMHGSINWYQNDSGGVFRGTSSEGGGARRVIHPSHLKYQQSRRLPYLAMIDRLRAFMKKPGATLILCGFSFRDEHLNEVILQGLECSQTAAAFALMYGAISEYPDACALAERRSNLSVLCSDGGIIGGRQGGWPDTDGSKANTEDTEWIKWKPVDTGNGGGAKCATLGLGDFSVLGRFVAEIAGIALQPAPEGAK
ncbi:MAG: SIR2 family protein [Desulforhabdus sp.]|jgi:hypothetical protein|nr:SIR2 family protein [Desulforhabdus sp.]